MTFRIVVMIEYSSSLFSEQQPLQYATGHTQQKRKKERDVSLFLFHFPSRHHLDLLLRSLAVDSSNKSSCWMMDDDSSSEQISQERATSNNTNNKSSRSNSCCLLDGANAAMHALQLRPEKKTGIQFKYCCGYVLVVPVHSSTT